MKHFAFAALIGTLAACGVTAPKSQVASHTSLTDEQYYDKVTLYTSFLPCAAKVTREGSMMTIQVKEGKTGQDCADMLRWSPTLLEIKELNDNELQVEILKTSSQEMVIDALKKNVNCASDIVATDKGIELTLKLNQPTAACLKFVEYYFNVTEKTDTKVVLDYVSNGFTCKTDDQTVTINHYKDFGHPSTSDIFDVFTYASLTQTDEQGVVVKEATLNHCEMTTLNRIPGEDIPRGVYSCQSEAGDLRHEFRFGPWAFSQVLVIDGVEQPTYCKWPSFSPN